MDGEFGRLVIGALPSQFTVGLLNTIPALGALGAVELEQLLAVLSAVPGPLFSSIRRSGLNAGHALPAVKRPRS